MAATLPAISYSRDTARSLPEGMGERLPREKAVAFNCESRLDKAVAVAARQSRAPTGVPASRVRSSDADGALRIVASDEKKMEPAMTPIRVTMVAEPRRGGWGKCS